MVYEVQYIFSLSLFSEFDRFKLSLVYSLLFIYWVYEKASSADYLTLSKKQLQKLFLLQINKRSCINSVKSPEEKEGES